jgi:hypothetical protein
LEKNGFKEEGRLRKRSLIRRSASARKFREIASIQFFTVRIIATFVPTVEFKIHLPHAKALGKRMPLN